MYQRVHKIHLCILLMMPQLCETYIYINSPYFTNTFQMYETIAVCTMKISRLTEFINTFC